MPDNVPPVTVPPRQKPAVLNCGRGVASAHCAKLLRELGLGVVMVEPPDGHPLRRSGDSMSSDFPDSDQFVYLAGGIGSIVAEGWPAMRDADAHALMRQTDLLIHDFQPAEARRLGLDEATVRSVSPGTVVLAITPFGPTGPYADLPATDLTLYALSGHLQLTGRPGQAPIMPYGSQPSMYGGLHAAVAAVASLVGTLRGQPSTNIHVSILDSLIGSLDSAINSYTYQGVLRQRYGNRTADDIALTDLYRTKDGAVIACVYTDVQWESFCRLIARLDWLDDPDLRTLSGRRRRDSELAETMSEWFRQRSSQQAFEELQKARIPAAPFSDLDALLSDPQLTHRAFFGVTGIDGAQVKMPTLPWRTTIGRSPVETPPAPGQNGVLTPQRGLGNSTPIVLPQLPLSGLRVLDFTHAWAGPFASMQLAFLGAEVLKIEGAGRPDGARYVSTGQVPGQPDYESGGYFQEFNRAKKSVVLNLEIASARETFKQLAAQSDVLVTNFSSRVLPNLGLDWGSLSAIHPGLILVTMPAFGTGGPYGEYVGYGEVVEGSGGLASLSGHPPEDPIRSGVAYADPLAGLYAALAALGGLMNQYLGQAGDWFDVSHQECVARMIGDAIVGHQRGQQASLRDRAHRDEQVEGVFATSGCDQWIAVTARTQLHLEALNAIVVNRQEVGDADQYLRSALETWALQHDNLQAMKILTSAGIPAGAAMKIPDLINNDHLRQTEFFAAVEHACSGPTEHPGAAFTFTTPGGQLYRRDVEPAPKFDQHTDQVLSGLRDWTSRHVSELRAAGAIGGQPTGTSPVAR